jgi:hypothetical protein
MMYYNSNSTATISYGSNHPSFMSGGQQQQHQEQSFNDAYTALILEEAEKIYNQLITELTNRVMVTAAADIRASSLPSQGNSNQKLTYKIDNTYQTEESRYNQNRNL